MSHEISHTYKEKWFYDILRVKALKKITCVENDYNEITAKGRDSSQL